MGITEGAGGSVLRARPCVGSVGLVGGLVLGHSVKTLSGSLDHLLHPPHSPSPILPPSPPPNPYPPATPLRLTPRNPTLECIVGQRLCLLISGPIVLGLQQGLDRCWQMTGQVDRRTKPAQQATAGPLPLDNTCPRPAAGLSGGLPLE